MLFFELMRLQHLLIRIRIVHLEVIEELAALRHFAQEPAARGEVLLVLGKVLAQKVDLLGEDGDLDGRGSGVFVMRAVLGDETFLDRALDGHRRKGDRQREFAPGRWNSIESPAARTGANSMRYFMESKHFDAFSILRGRKHKTEMSGQTFTLCYDAGMDALSFSLGLLGGIIVGTVLTIIVLRKSSKDAESVAETLSARVMARQAEQILQLAESKLSGKKDVIDESIKSVKSDLKRAEELMGTIRDSNVKIDERLGNAATAIKELKDTTGSLQNALASNSERGQWGERMAEDVLRLSGLVEGINYIKQKKLEGAGSKPDITFLLPQNLKLNLDAKFPFNNYQLYAKAKTEKEREDYKKAFLKDVKKRVKEVQTRDYINPEDNTMDYVLLFIPNEQIFGFINEVDRSLIDEAMEGKTILCSPLSLYAILAVIRQAIDTFSLESKSKEVLSILGSFRYQWDKFKGQMETVKKRFESVHSGFDDLAGKRERMLDIRVKKIDELRLQQGIPVAELEDLAEETTQAPLVLHD